MPCTFAVVGQTISSRALRGWPLLENSGPSARIVSVRLGSAEFTAMLRDFDAAPSYPGALSKADRRAKIDGFGIGF